MQIQLIAGTVMLLRATRRELHRRGMEPEGLELRDVLVLIREGCQEVGVKSSAIEEIDAYPEKSGVLVFVMLKQPDKEWFAFPGLSEALDALLSAPEPDGELVFWERYYISAHKDALCRRYSEFGETAARSEWATIEERAALVLERESLRQLWRRLKKQNV